MVTVRDYRSGDEPALLATWNAALPLDPIDASTFRRRVLLDPNFGAGRLLVTEVGDGLAGFCLCVMRRMPNEAGDLESRRGWITAFGVVPEHRRRGVGTALLRRALDRFRTANRTEVLIAPYTPNYFVPGVDENHYAEGLAFMQDRKSVV